jgi:hypothetical protein
MNRRSRTATREHRLCIDHKSPAVDLQQPARHTLKAVDEFGKSDLRWIERHQLNVIVLATALFQFCAEVLTDLGEDCRKVFDR